MELVEVPNVSIDPTPLISEYAAQLIQKLLAVLSGLLLASTPVSSEVVTNWATSTVTLLVDLVPLAIAYVWSLFEVKKVARNRAKLAQQVVQYKREFLTLQSATLKGGA